jgi:hypothetical protein
MTSNTANKFFPDVRAPAVRMVLYHEADHLSYWAAAGAISSKTGCRARTLMDRV